jgi:two-component system sensor kinase FixL
MGIGLSLSRTIIEAHGGTLWLDKEFKDGASFGFVVPAVS